MALRQLLKCEKLSVGQKKGKTVLPKTISTHMLVIKRKEKKMET